MINDLRKLAKKAFDLGWTEHSNTLISRQLVQHASTLPSGQTRTRLIKLAVYVNTHPELCYDDFKKWADDQWYPDYDLLQACIDAVKHLPRVMKFFVRYSEKNHDMENIQ